jgi:hypothetical protein
MPKTPVLHSANFTVVGNFNPMILTHDFLIDVCRFNQLGESIKQTPKQFGVVSEIIYQKFRWFMDLNRMIVENIGLQELSDFTSPELGVHYLEILPYTPVFAAGINIHTEVSISDPQEFWMRFSSPDAFIVALDKLDASNAEIISRMGISQQAFSLTECTLVFNRGSDVRISLRIKRVSSSDKIKIDFNHEWANFATQRHEKLTEIRKTYLDVANELFRLAVAIWPEVML